LRPRLSPGLPLSDVFFCQEYKAVPGSFALRFRHSPFAELKG
jgi:hypothetical protein